MLSILVALIWVVVISGIAMIPYPRHAPYAGAMLLLLPVVLGFVAWQHGPWPAVVLFLAAASIFRKPLAYLLRRLTGGDREGGE